MVFSLAVLLVYAVAPAIIANTILPGGYFLRLTGIAIVGVLSMWCGSYVALFDGQFRPGAPRLELDARVLVAVTWVIFSLFVLATLVSARSIPLISALQGADAKALSQERGDFLKGRQGAGIALLYLSTILISTVVPYSIVLMYSIHSRVRHLLSGLFFLFCISFLQKALFLTLVLPLLSYFAATRRLRGIEATAWLGGSVTVLLLATVLSLGTDAAGQLSDVLTAADYFTARFTAGSSLQYFLWRAFAVPIFTAADTLTVHMESFGGRPLLGATSSLISFLFGFERVNLERFVFEYQFGGWNDIANANAVYVVDAFVNFGWAGVIVFGLIVGQIFRWFRISGDIAFQALWPLFAFVLFSASLIGMMLSNGFLLMIFFALFVRVRTTPRSRAVTPQLSAITD